MFLIHVLWLSFSSSLLHKDNLVLIFMSYSRWNDYWLEHFGGCQSVATKPIFRCTPLSSLHKPTLENNTKPCHVKAKLYLNNWVSGLSIFRRNYCTTVDKNSFLQLFSKKVVRQSTHSLSLVRRWKNNWVSCGIIQEHMFQGNILSKKKEGSERSSN